MRTVSSTRSARGKASSFVVPTPSWLRAPTCPPDCLTNPHTIDKPSLVPLPNASVEKERLEDLRHDLGRHAADR